MKWLAMICLATLVGCAYPSTNVRSVESRPSIAISGAAKGATLVVDGLSMGDASQFDGKPKALLLEPGRHRVEVKSGGVTLLSKEVFLGAEGMTYLFVGSGGQ